jgi:hypothetical protein
VGCVKEDKCVCGLQEESIAYFNDIEQLDDDCSDTSEEGRPAFAFHLVAVPLYLHECPPLSRDILADSRGIYILHRGQEHGVQRPDGRCIGRNSYAQSGEEVKVSLQRTGVCAEILMRRKLGWVHEDGDDGEVVLCEGSFD